MKPNRYIIHDVYHVTNNLSLLNNSAKIADIIHHTKIAGKRYEHIYTDTQIKKCLNYLETKKMIKQVKKGEYII